MADGLTSGGWTLTAVAGRDESAAGARELAGRLGSTVAATEEVGRGAEVVVVATPDALVAPVASRSAPGLEPHALVVHLSGAAGLDVFDELRRRRPDVRVGAAHPLQTLRGAPGDGERLSGSWFAVEDDGRDDRPSVTDLTAAVGGRPFRVADRRLYHAAAVVASNHLVALLGQLQRLASLSGAPVEAFEPLVRAAVDNACSSGAAGALTGPVARGDLATITRHLDALPASEQSSYRALAREALRLTGRHDPELEALLADREGVVAG